MLDEVDALPPPPMSSSRGTRSTGGSQRPRAARGILEAIAIVGVVLVAIYAGYTVLGSSNVIDLTAIQDAGSALGLPVRPRTVPTATPAPVLAQPTPTPRQVIVPQVALPSPTATAAPPPPASAPPATAPAPVEAAARVSDPAPPRGSNLNVIMKLTRDNKPIAGVPVHIVAHYRTLDERFPRDDGTVPTNENGEATVSFNVGDATVGHTVNVDVIAQVEGETIQAQTSFTPR